MVALAAEHHGNGPVQRRDVIMVRQDPTVIIVRDRAGADLIPAEFALEQRDPRSGDRKSVV